MVGGVIDTRSRLYEQSWPEGDYRFFQMGFVVDDVLAAAATWARTFGIGPFHVLPVVEQDAIYRGTPAPIMIQVGVAQAGPVQIELIQQHSDGPSIYREWNRGSAGGFHQLATVTTEYEGTKAHYESLGYEVVAESLNNMRVAYIDTVADFGFYIEVVEGGPEFLKQLSAISKACASWDGTDPVRLLTRDGYRTP